MNSDNLVQLLMILLAVMISILVILSVVYMSLKLKTNIKSKKVKENKKSNKNEKVNIQRSQTTKAYNKQSIYDFMEFDKIEDNMIIQKDGKRFLMVIGCQGINYDLMSGLEKNSVEQGFLQFLNTLRYPIQIYVQTRTVNLTSSIDTYKSKIDQISRDLVNKQMQYNEKVRSGQYTQRQLDIEKFEIIRQKNLFEYGQDIVNSTARMSLNRNILSKHYYVIIPYYSEEAGNFDKAEIANMAFSELYTKAQAIISSLSVCGINAKVLDSMELTELLYVAYNRDEYETYNLERTLSSGYEDLYTTAPDVFEKRLKELDEKIEREALQKANEIVFDVIEESQKEKEAKQKEKDMDDLITQMAKAMIRENKKDIGNRIAEKAIEKIEKSTSKTKEEGEDENGKKTTSRRTRKSV